MLKNQAHVEKKKKRTLSLKQHIKQIIIILSVFVFIALCIKACNVLYKSLFNSRSATKIVQSKKPARTTKFSGTKFSGTKFSESVIKKILAGKNFLNSEKKNFNIIFQNESFQVNTSLDIELQHFLVNKINNLQKLGRGKPQQIAMVVMKPDSGQILALTGFDSLNPGTNPCFNNKFPAASIFKIITASAAVEELGFTQYTPVYFNGGKYTLYKRQLENIKNKYTCKLSFANAFAESINPVFGKIGKNRLKNKILKNYGDKFGFNKKIDSQLMFEPSKLTITDDPYEWAEIGCGFINTTTISPIFAAIISSTIANDGKRVSPIIIDKIVDSKNNLIYDKKNLVQKETISKDSALIIQALMQKTIETGTARKAFRGRKQDKILSKLIIGGKTGSIYNKKHTIKYDWFTGFVKQIDNTTPENKGPLALSIIVGHGKYIGTRASYYGKMIIKEYYKNI